jgi:hypothetical protein
LTSVFIRLRAGVSPAATLPIKVLTSNAYRWHCGFQITEKQLFMGSLRLPDLINAPDATLAITSSQMVLDA